MTSLHRVAHPAGIGVERPPDRRVLIAAAVAAILTDLAVRSGVAGVAGTVLVAAVVCGMLASGRVQHVQARALLVAALPFGACLAVRMSPWLLPLDILAAASLLVSGASLARGGSVLDLPFADIAVRAIHALVHGLAAPAFLAEPLPQRRPAALLRGAALAVPLLVALGLLLASADAVFAGFFDWLSPVTVIVHGVLLAVGAWGMAGLLRVASAEDPPAAPRLPWRIGSGEATVVLGSIVALFATFAAAQVVAVTGGERHVLRTTGLTYAEYARSGFFQLLAVAAITLIALVGLRAVTDTDDASARRRFTILAELAAALTVVIVVVALRRLGLYQRAFGLTMLRLYSSVFAVWIGVVVVLAGCALAGLGARRAWFPASTAATGLVLLLGLNIANPEAIVVRHNLDRAASTQKVDPSYLGELSDDAVPAMVARLPGLPAPIRAEVLAAICGGREPPFDGWWASNAARRRAIDARRQACRVTR